MKSLGSRYNQHSFAQVPSVHTARSKFDRSFAAKDTHNFDYLNPIFVDEMVPGDSATVNVKTFIRLATQIVPFMDNVTFDFFSFFVPSRLVWNNWEKFMGAKENPNDITEYLLPQIESPEGGWAVGSLGDKFGIPTGVECSVNALPFRCYQLIWNDWFRDQNLQNSIQVPKGDGPDSPTEFILRKRAKLHDYFTSALPWPQKGGAVELPLGQHAPLVFQNQPSVGNPPNPVFRDAQTGTPITTGNITATSFGPNPAISTAVSDQLAYDPQGTLVADLSEATAATINQLRQAMMMQSLLELDARGGTRYVEIIRAHFNVVSPDFRLQRPEYLGGGRVTLNQHPVAQTSETTENGTPQGNLAAYSTASHSGNNIGFTKAFVEHGYVIILMQARGDVTYQQGLNKLWSRETRWDFFWPKFQELGEQTITKGELYLTGTDADKEPWGYQERYAEMRYRPSEIRGQFRSTFAESLDVWHLAEEFVGLPTLSGTFIESNTPIERVLEVTDPAYPHLLCDFWFDYKHARPMTTYGIPATLGRF